MWKISTYELMYVLSELLDKQINLYPKIINTLGYNGKWVLRIGNRI